MNRARHVNWSSLYTPASFVQMLFGVGLATLALKGFMIPNHFLDGGMIGISLLTSDLLEINLSILLILGNLGFMMLCWMKVSRDVAVRSSIAIILLSVGLEVVDITPVTTDKLLIAVFGGVILGAGVGLVVRSGGALDGTEILALLTIRRIGLTVTEVILLLNTVIFLIAGINSGLEVAMYSIITYFTAGKAVDYVVDGLEEYTALTIISSKSDQIQQVIVNDFGKGITVYKGERGFLPGSFEQKYDCDIIVTVVTRLELLGLKKAVTSIDPAAFMYVYGIREASGGVIREKKGY